jgi:hypothetical protein
MIMSTGTPALGRVDAVVRTAPKSGGFFQRVMRRIVEAQERKARAMVNGFLASQSDERLADLGYDAAEIKSIRRTAAAPMAWL